MKLQLDAILVDAEDAPVIEKDEPVQALVLLKRAVLSDAGPDGRPIAGEEKIKRFELFLKLKFADSTTSFSLDEVQLMDKAILVYPTLIAGQLHYVLTQK
jgi:hypothetical protein